MTQAAVLAAYGSSSSGLAFKNRIINGDMRIDQRNAGAAVSTGAGNNYTLDRMFLYDSVGGKMQSQQVTDAPAGFSKSLKVTSLAATTASASDLYFVGQRIEGFNIADFGFGTASAVPVTLSFLVKSSLTGTFSGYIGNGYSNDRNYVFTYTINTANTWEYKTVTVAGSTNGTWDITNGVGMQAMFDLGSGSNYQTAAGVWNNTDKRKATGSVSVINTSGATFYITGVQLEKDTGPTQFEFRDFPTELIRCMRYYEKSFSYGTAPAHNTGGLPVIPIGGNLGCGGNSYWIIPFKATKRTSNYSVRWYDPLEAHPNSENWLRVITSCNSGSAVGPNSSIVVNSNTTAHWGGYSQVGTAVPPIFFWTVEDEL